MYEFWHRLKHDPATARKFFVAVAGVFLVAATQGLFPAPITPWVTILASAITAGGVYAVPNKEASLNE